MQFIKKCVNNMAYMFECMIDICNIYKVTFGFQGLFSQKLSANYF